jgi:hypothetical protein
MKNIRPFGWVIIALNVYFFIAYFSSYDINASDTVNGFGIMFLIFWLAIMNTFLYVLYKITGGKKRDCPACGVGVKKGLTICQACNFDFAKAASGEVQNQPSEVLPKQENAIFRKFNKLHPLIQVPVILIGCFLVIFIATWILAPFSLAADETNCGLNTILHFPCTNRFKG